MDAAPAVVCRVCTRQFSRYTCPRCNMRYCSLECYKKHSEQCTEGFYRENTVEELQGTQVDSKQRQEVLEILKRVHESDQQDGMEFWPGPGGEDVSPGLEEEDSDEDSDQVLSEETMKKLLLKAEAGAVDIEPEDLSPEDLEAFRRAVASGSISHLIEQWVPWWTTAEARAKRLTPAGTALVAEAAAAEAGEGDAEEPSTVPAGPSEPLPKLREMIGGGKPSPLLRWHLLDVLYAYCSILRHFNGDVGADQTEAVALAAQISAVLSRSPPGPESPVSSPDVLTECMATAAALPGLGGRTLALHACQDVLYLLSAGRGCVVCALWDLRRAVEGALMESPAGAGGNVSAKDLPKGKDPTQWRKHLKGLMRKLLFMTAWANELPAAVYTELAEVCGLQWSRAEEMLQAEAAAGRIGQQGNAQGLPGVLRGLSLGAS